MDLSSFVNSKIVGQNDEFSHTVMATYGKIYKCRFNLSGLDEHTQFFKLYEAKLKQGADLGITEQHRGISPVLIDLDFRSNISERKYTLQNIIDFCQKITHIICSYVEIPDDHIQVYLLEKPAPKRSKLLFKDGVHIMIPSIVTNRDVQYAVRDEFLDKYQNYFADLSTTSDKEVYDKDVIFKNGWLMYGSKKEDDRIPWYVSKLITINKSDFSLVITDVDDIGCKDTKYVQMLSIRNKYKETIVTKQVPLQNDIKSSKTQGKQLKVKSDIKDKTTPTDLLFAHRIVDLLSVDRSNNYSTWIAVGWCLYNIESPIDDECLIQQSDALSKWVDFSRKSSKFVSGECEKLWGNMNYTADGYKMGSLIAWGRQDAPEEMAELEEEFKVPDTIGEIMKSVKPQMYSYHIVKKAFEKEVAMVVNPQTMYIQQCVGGMKEGVIMNDKCDLKEKYGYLKCTVWNGKEYKPRVFLDIWFADYHKRRYHECAFLPPPQPCPADVYNMWPGFDIDKIQIESSNNIQPFLNHISILTNHQQASTDYFIKWLAQMIQKPGAKIGIAIIIISKEGTGKNLFLNGIRNMIGEHLYYETPDPKKTLFDRFSNGRLNKLLINIDEAQVRDTFSAQQELKNMITSETFNFEKKGKDPITIQDFSRIILTSNNSLVVKLEPNSRRYVVFEASSEKIGKAAYFDGLQAYMTDRSNQKAIIEYLRSVDIGNVNWQADKPINDAYLNMMQQCVDPVLRFLEWTYIKHLRNQPIHVEPSVDVLTSFKQFMKTTMNMSDTVVNTWTATRFGIKLNEYIKEAPDAIIKKKNMGKEFIRAYQFTKEPLEKLLQKYSLLREISYMFVAEEE